MSSHEIPKEVPQTLVTIEVPVNISYDVKICAIGDHWTPQRRLLTFHADDHARLRRQGKV